MGASKSLSRIICSTSLHRFHETSDTRAMIQHCIPQWLCHGVRVHASSLRLYEQLTAHQMRGSQLAKIRRRDNKFRESMCEYRKQSLLTLLGEAAAQKHALSTEVFLLFLVVG